MNHVSIFFLFQTLNFIPDQDTFYDITDQLEVQGMEQLTQKLTSRSGSDLDLMEQIRIYEVSLWWGVR